MQRCNLWKCGPSFDTSMLSLPPGYCFELIQTLAVWFCFCVHKLSLWFFIVCVCVAAKTSSFGKEIFLPVSCWLTVPLACAAIFARLNSSFACRCSDIPTRPYSLVSSIGADALWSTAYIFYEFGFGPTALITAASRRYHCVLGTAGMPFSLA